MMSPDDHDIPDVPWCPWWSMMILDDPRWFHNDSWKSLMILWWITDHIWWSLMPLMIPWRGLMISDDLMIIMVIPWWSVYQDKRNDYIGWYNNTFPNLYDLITAVRETLQTSVTWYQRSGNPCKGNNQHNQKAVSLNLDNVLLHET